MEIVKGSAPNIFDLKGVTFSQLTTVKKACDAYAKQGSSVAADFVKELNEALNNTSI